MSVYRHRGKGHKVGGGGRGGSGQFGDFDVGHTGRCDVSMLDGALHSADNHLGKASIRCTEVFDGDDILELGFNGAFNRTCTTLNKL